MAVSDRNIVDGIAYECETLIMEIYDHLDFEGKFEFDHISILQDKLNTYIWYINSQQYADTYPDRTFRAVIINVHFLHESTDNCKKFIEVSNGKLSALNVKIISVTDGKHLS